MIADAPTTEQTPDTTVLEAVAEIVSARGYLSAADKALRRSGGREAARRDIDRAIGRLVTAYCVLRQP